MERLVYKEHHLKPEKLADVLETAEPGRSILIVFWHGVGDTLMFLPVYQYLQSAFPEHDFDLALLPGVGQAEYLGALAIPESEFLTNHDAAFVISFPMIEGTNTMTKAEYCCVTELGLPVPESLTLPMLGYVPNKLVGLHLQGTCLPGSTNPDDQLAQQIWQDVRNAGYVPIDLHFEHVFHNPVNHPLSWTNRNCRDLKPDLRTLQMLINRCMAVLAVASGPFVLAASCARQRTIYLQKHHTIGCYMRDFPNVIDLLAYGDTANPGRQEAERQRLLTMLNHIEVNNV